MKFWKLIENWNFGTLNFDVKIRKNKMEMWVPRAWKRVGRYLSGGNNEKEKINKEWVWWVHMNEREWEGVWVEEKCEINRYDDYICMRENRKMFERRKMWEKNG